MLKVSKIDFYMLEMSRNVHQIIIVFLNNFIDSNEKSRENAIILNLEKQICKNLNIGKSVKCKNFDFC